MTETKSFPLRVLLTVTTGRLLTAPNNGGNGIEGLYEILGWMTNDSPFTHQLGRFAEECKPWLLRWFPELSHAETPSALGRLDILLAEGNTSVKVNKNVAVDAWLEHMQTSMPGVLKATYDVPHIPADDHERKHPFDELVAMRGTDEGIIVVKP